MAKHLGKHTHLLIGLLALAILTLAVLPTWAAPNTTTKVLFLRHSGSDTNVYRTFLGDPATGVYAGQTMVYDDVRDDFYTENPLSVAKVARLKDADLIIQLDGVGQWWVTGAEYTDFATFKSLQAPIISHYGVGLSQHGWGWFEAYGTQPTSHGPDPGVSAGTLVKPRWLDKNSEPFFTMGGGVLGSHLGPPTVLADAGTVADPGYLWAQIFTSARPLTEINWGNSGGGGIKLLCIYKGNNGGMDTNWNGNSSAVMIRWPQDGALQYTTTGPAAARRFWFDLAPFNDNDTNVKASGAGSAAYFLSTAATADGKLALKNALTLMYDPQYGRRPTISASSTPLVVTHSGAADVYASVIDVAITNGGTLPEPTITWTVLPAAGYDAAGSTNLNTASPTFHFTADGTYTATVKAQKPGQDYVSATKTIQVLTGDPVTKILFVQGKDSRDLSAYKSFLTTVYPGRTMVFSGDALADKYAFSSTANGALTPAQLARITDADLVILTPDINSTDYITPDWARLNVPMIMHSVPLQADSTAGWGWIGGYFEGSGAMPSHNPGVSDGMAGDQWYGGNQWSTDSFFAGMTGHFVAANPDASGDPNANWFPLFNTAGYTMGGSINSDSWGAGKILFSGNGSTRYNDKSFITRWAQGNTLGRPGTSAASRRFVFNMGASNNTDAVNTFFNPATGANGNGLLALQHALTYLYNPANGRRPVPNAGPAAQLDLGVSTNLTVSDATYNDGDGGSVGTLLWTIVGVNPADTAKVTITAGATTLTPTFHFTGTGVFTATLAGTKPNLDTVYSRKTITVVQATLPAVKSVLPAAGFVVNSVPASIVVTFNQTVSGVGALTVNGTPLTGSSLDGGQTWTFATTGVALPAVNGPFNCSLDTHLVVGTFGGLTYPNPTYSWAFYYNPAVTPTNIVLAISAEGDTAEINAYTAFLKTVYGPSATVTMQSDYEPDGGIDTMNATVQARLNAANLVIVARDYNNWGSLNKAFFTTYAKAMLVTCPDAVGDTYWRMTGQGTPGSGTSYAPFAINPLNWILRGITIPSSGQLPVYKTPYAAAERIDYPYWRGWPNATPERWQNPGMVLEQSSADVVPQANFWDDAIGVAMYWPPNTTFAVNPVDLSANYFNVTHAGRRGFFALGYAKEIFPNDNLTAEGKQVLVNMLTTLYPVPSYPAVYSTNPPNASPVSTAPATISISMDRSVTGVGTLSLNGLPIAAVAVASNENRTWTWTIPVNQRINLFGTVNASVAMSGVTETDSGFALPYQGASYGWSFPFIDKGTFPPTISLVSNDNASQDDHSAYTSFLLNDVYSTLLTATPHYTHQVVIEDVRGKYYNMTAPTRAALEATASLVIVLPYQTGSAIGAGTQWNALNVPILLHKADTGQSWGWTDQVSKNTLMTPEGWMVNIGFVLTRGDVMVTPGATPTTDPFLTGVGSFFANPWGTESWYTSPWGTIIGAMQFWNTIPTYQFAALNGYGSGTNQLGGGFPLKGINWDDAAWAARWNAGNALHVGGNAVARRAFLTMGQSEAVNSYGQDTVASFFAPTGAYDLGAKQILRNELRWLMNPDSLSSALTVKTASPSAGGSAGVLGPITVIFSKPASGVLAGDLRWNASTSAVTYFATTAVPTGPVPSDTWIFDGVWETNGVVTGQFQPINITINALDTPSHSHITSADGQGLPLTTWTWNYVWNPVPASVSGKLWTLYE